MEQQCIETGALEGSDESSTVGLAMLSFVADRKLPPQHRKLIKVDRITH
jgi:hypothetical protein